MESARQLAIVTGASSGIGFELAKQFAQNGFDVVMAAEDERLMTAASEVRAMGVEAIPVQVDLATAEGNEELHRQVLATGRPIDALALNAGIAAGGNFVDTPLDADRRVIELNITSVVHLAKLFVPLMVRRGQGRVLITASVASTMPGPYYATYAASKAFDLSFTEALRHELKDTGVTVTALMPGPTDTDFFRRGNLENTAVGKSSKDDPADVAHDGFEALMAGDDHVVAGSMKNKLQVIGAKAMPEPAKAALHGRMTKPENGNGT